MIIKEKEPKTVTGLRYKPGDETHEVRNSAVTFLRTSIHCALFTLIL